MSFWEDLGKTATSAYLDDRKSKTEAKNASSLLAQQTLANTQATAKAEATRRANALQDAKTMSNQIALANATNKPIQKDNTLLFVGGGVASLAVLFLLLKSK